MSDQAEFEQLLATMSQEYADAEPFERWDPPEGDWTVIFKNPRHGVISKNNEKFLYWSIGCQILNEANPEVHEKTFSLMATSKVFGIVKAYASALAGKRVDAASGINEAFEGAVGKGGVIHVEKGKNDYLNYTITQVFDLEASEDPSQTAQ